MKVQGVQDASTHHQQCCRGYCSLQSLPLHRHRRHRPASRESKIRLHPQGQWNVTCVGSIRCKTHVALPRYTTNSELTSGAMDEMSQKVQQASKPKMPDLSTRWCWSASPCLGCRVPRPVSQETRARSSSIHRGDG